MIRLTLILLLFYTGVHAQNSDKNFSFYFGGMYGKSSRSGFDPYLNAVKDSLHAPGGFSNKPAAGVALGVLIRGKKSEFELGGYVLKNNYRLASQLNGLDPRFNCSDIELHMGVNLLPAKILIIGAHLSSNAETITLKEVEGTAFEDAPTTNFNIFRGYSIGLKAIAGLNIPLNKEKTGFLRITPFYYLGATKYDFKKSADRYLKNYSGSTKTALQSQGIIASLIISL